MFLSKKNKSPKRLIFRCPNHVAKNCYLRNISRNEKSSGNRQRRKMHNDVNYSDKERKNYVLTPSLEKDEKCDYVII